MQIPFVKYQGTGNDFILADGRHIGGPLIQEDVARWCDRHFGIGADGLMVIYPAKDSSHDYIMDYYNADGRLGSMCGNGARCAFRFAQNAGLAGMSATFIAFDGSHHAEESQNGEVSVSLRDVQTIERRPDDIYVLNTGSPHYVRFVSNIESVDVLREGRSVRNSTEFASKGVNVNFAEIQNAGIRVRTYERGVEDITLSCGTGVTAVALAYAAKQNLTNGPVQILADGGKLLVDFVRNEATFTNIRLYGPATKVFEGTMHTGTE